MVFFLLSWRRDQSGRRDRKGTNSRRSRGRYLLFDLCRWDRHNKNTKLYLSFGSKCRWGRLFVWRGLLRSLFWRLLRGCNRWDHHVRGRRGGRTQGSLVGGYGRALGSQWRFYWFEIRLIGIGEILREETLSIRFKLNKTSFIMEEVKGEKEVLQIP